MTLIRAFVSLFVSLEIILTSAFGGVLVKSPEMPQIEQQTYGQYVDPFIGTGGIPWVCAMVSPAATVPFGSVRLGPDTCNVTGTYLLKTNTSGYYYEHGHIRGFSHSRLSGTGAEDYSCFRVTPAVGDKKAGVLPYTHTKETASPGYYALYMPSIGCMAELTATQHTGVHRYSFNTDKDARLYLDVTSGAAKSKGQNGYVKFDEATGVIKGGCLLFGQFAGRFDGLPIYFAAVASKPVKSYEISSDPTDCGIDLNFGSLENDSVELRVGISFVSEENAALNLAAESEKLSFDETLKKAAAEWEDRLSSVKINTGDEEVKKIFYTALYHTMIMPTNFTDVNGEYLNFKKEVATAKGYTYRTDMSLWDTCRTTHPLYTLIAPDIQRDCLKSLVEMAKAGGALPRWPMGAGYSGSMMGDPANIVITESYLKGYTDFDAQTAYEYMKKSSDGPVPRVGRNYVDMYNEYGYVPQDLAPGDESVSRTLEYAWQDAAIATLASELGYSEDAAKYTAKSMYYKNVFNPKNKYFQARNSDGSFVWNFIPGMTSFYDMVMIKKFADCYCEGSARQWRWSAVHDIDGMIDLFGSKEYFVSELEDFMKDASLSRAAIDPGAGFWIGNQHDIHTPYLFNNAGRPDLTQKWVRWTLKERFSTDINGLDGNDDGGTISAWYVFSALGFYPLAGTDKYWIGSPNIDSAEVTLANGKILKITAKNQGEKNVYVSSVALNGEKLDGFYITHEQLMSGGELVFEMSKNPN